MFITLPSVLKTPAIPMGKTCKIVRKSIYTFFKRYQYFTSTAAVLALPFSLSVLLSHGLIPSSSYSLRSVFDRLRTIFNEIGLPSSGIFNAFNLKISQTIASYVITLPFNLTFLLLTKAAVIQALKHRERSSIRASFSSLISIYGPLLTTYVCNFLLILSANATVFALFFLAFNFFEGLGFNSSNSLIFLSAVGALIYSVIIANVLVVCNLALVLSGMERCAGYMAILKACVMMRGRTLTALSLALQINLAFASCEVLFRYRILRVYHAAKVPSSSLALEGLFIAYLYSILVVLDTLINCLFFKSCEKNLVQDHESCSCRIEIVEEDGSSCTSLKDIIYMVEESGNKQRYYRIVVG